MNNYYVYMHTTPSGKRYIGVTKQKPTHRWGMEGQNYKTNHHFWNAIRKYGWDNIEHTILFSGVTQEQASELEKCFVKVFNTHDPKHGYNRTTGGEYGFEFTDEVKKQMSHPKKLSDGRRKELSERGKLNYKMYLKGRKMTPEQIEKIAEAKRGQKQSKEVIEKRRLSLKKTWEAKGGITQEHRDKISKALKGKTRSKEFCQKMKEAHCTEKNGRSRRVRQLTESKEIVNEFASVREAERKTGITYTSIVRVCNGVRLKHAGGYRWEYC